MLSGGISKSPDNRKNHNQLFRLRLYCQEAKTFLEKITPYLKVKKEQAKLAIEFQSKMKTGKRTVSKEEQENYKIRISSFKKKGRKRLLVGS